MPRPFPATGRLASAALVLLIATPAVGQERRFVDLSLDPARALWIQGDASDTVLADPNRISLVHDMVIVTDPRGPSVTALSGRTGERLWQYHREGNGPGEMREPVLAAPSGANLLVLDNRTRRFYWLDRSGRFLREERVPQGAFVAGICPRADGRMVLHVAATAGSRLLLHDPTGGVTTGLPAAFRTEPSNPNDGVYDAAAGPDGRCVLARKAADGLAVLGESRVLAKASFVERIRQRPFVPVEQIRDTTQLPIPYSLNLSVDRGLVYVWFAGATRCQYRCIDVYDLQTLAYRHTIRFTGRLGIELRNVLVGNGRLFLLGTRDDVPTVAAFALPGVP